MIRKKKNNVKKISARPAVYAAACAAAFCSAVLPFFGQFSLAQNGQFVTTAETTAEKNSASPQNAPLAENLYLPNSYQQYLNLENPSSVAVSENYTAIADGLTLYIYSRARNAYASYTHEIAGDTKITQVQFDENETLYFSAQGSTHLYTAQPNNVASTLTDTNIACSAFDIYQDTLYYTTISGSEANISSRSVSALNVSRQPLESNVPGKPAIAYNGETLYYTVGKLLTALDRSGAQTLESAPQSIAFSGEYCYFTDAEKNLYSCRYTSGTAPTDVKKYAEPAVSVSVSRSDGYVYAVGNRKIRQIDPESREFTSFEISASSDSNGRLFNAVDTVLSGDTLFTLDQGDPAQNVGARILCTPAYKFGANEASTTGKTSTFPIEETDAKYIAAYGDTVLVATAPESSAQSGVLALYNTDGTPVKKFDAEENEPFVGVANVYGTFYAASKTHIYKLEKNPETQEYAIVFSKTQQRTNKLLAADVYGSVYLAQAHNVYTYTEDELSAALSGEAQSTLAKPVEEAIAVLPESSGGTAASTKLLVDFHRNVYALHGGALTKCAKTASEPAETYVMTEKTFVYAQTEETPVISAAFGVETEAAYILYDGNFIAATYDLPLPTVNTVSTEHVGDTLFAEEAADFTVVECAAKTLLVRFDVANLKDSEFFPYVSYARAAQKTPAISMGETAKYYVLAVYDQENNDYYTALAEKTSCEEISQEEFLTPPPEEYANGKTGYVTNAIPLYKYPYLTDLITVCPLQRGAAVRVLKTVERLDWKYYQVEYTDETGATKTGFLPASYVANTNGLVPEAEQTVLGGENNNRDLVWRLVYIILGTLVICILTDYLILRRNDK